LNISSMPAVRHLLAFCLVGSLVLTGVFFQAPATAFADSDGNQIVFAIAGNTFTDLTIVGDNQNGYETTWQQHYDYPRWLSKTNGYWWTGTVVLTFRTANGWSGGCVIDYLSEPLYDNTVYVTYTPGKGCTGGSGSAGVFVQEETVEAYAAASSATSPASCAIDFAKQLTGSGNIITLGCHCVKAAVAGFNLIAGRHGKTVHMPLVCLPLK
jgi:hypothetical protein